MNLEINYLAVLIAGVVSMAIGFVYYGPMVMGKSWMKEKGYNAESLKKAQKEMSKYYLISFVVSLITAYFLAHLMGLSQYFYNYPKLQTGLTSAFSAWLGFMMPVQLTATIFGNKNFKLFGIDTGYQLVSILGMGIVLGLL